MNPPPVDNDDAEKSKFLRLITHPSLLITFTLAALTLAFFHKLAFSGMILARGDVYTYFYPYWQARNEALLAGRIPLWTPDVFMGAPLLANSQVGVFYPPNWLTIPLDAPTAITLSVLIHVTWAMLGTYALARRTLALDRTPALLAAALFGLGGALGAKVENVNQLQALAWMPWLFLLFHHSISPPIGTRYISSLPASPLHKSSLPHLILLAIGLALQLLAGHPQTVFITLVGLGLYSVFSPPPARNRSHGNPLEPREPFLSPSPSQWRGGWGVRIKSLFLLLTALLVAALLAAPQLIPTLELAGESKRGGGLNPQQAMAFSLNPVLVGRGLLPSYDSLLFGEYIAYLGVIGLGLAVLGATLPFAFRLSPHRQPRPDTLPSQSRLGNSILPWLLLTILGFALALGLYNPLYWALAGLPGFSFFRVPARWLALFALGAALLAGGGLQSLQLRPRLPWWQFVLVAGVLLALGAASFLADRMAVDVIGSALPTIPTLVAWGMALAGLLLILWLTLRIGANVAVPVLCALAVIELFFASRVLAYNQVAPPDTYIAPRFTISQLQAYAEGETPPGRLLSISPILFDPGDKAALEARYRESGMSDLALGLALVATKLREILSPNLPLAWGLPSLDGFDGGLLPTEAYSDFTALLLPPGEEPSVDGRLREMLALSGCPNVHLPEQRWLNLTHTRYLIVDKVCDVVEDGIFYDLTHEITLWPSGSQTTIRQVPEFEADTLYALCRNAGGCFPKITLTYADGSTEVLDYFLDGSAQGYALAGLRLRQPRAPIAIDIQAEARIVRLNALTLVDSRNGAFQQVTLGPWQRGLSSDIKLYQNLDALPRAFVVSHVRAVPNAALALDQMRAPAFDPARTAVIQRSLAGLMPDTPPAQADFSRAAIQTYTPERVEIQVVSEQAGYLVLTDADYPGWQATVNGAAAEIYRADVLFRAVQIPPGESQVVFEYRPSWWPGSLFLGGAAWLAALVVLWWLTDRSRSLV